MGSNPDITIYVKDPNCGSWMKIRGDIRKGDAYCPFCHRSFDVTRNRSLALPPQASTLDTYYAGIPFQCPKCGHQSHAIQPFAGRKAACKCGKIIKLPKKEVLTLLRVNEQGNPDRSGLDRRAEERRSAETQVDRERRGGTDRRIAERRTDEP